MPNRNCCGSLRAGVASLIIFVLAVVSYSWILKLPLTAIDTIPTIAASRIDGIGDVPDLLTRELRGGAQRSAGAYYRPLCLATYTVDYLAWGWIPFGYHLTDLLLHGLAAFAVFWLARLALDFNVTQAFAVALIFSLHPGAIEVVPALARRQEPLLVIGFAVTLIGARYLPTRPGWIVTMLGALVTVTSVERGLVVPGVVFAFLLVCGREADLGGRVRRAILYSIPVFLLAVAFYVARSALFGGAGITFHAKNLIRIPLRFLHSIVYPQQMVDFQTPTTAAEFLVWGVVGLIVLVAIVWTVGRSRCLAVCAFAGLWVGGYCLLFAVAGQIHSWYTYTAVPAYGLGLVSLGTRGLIALRGGGPGMTRGVVALAVVTFCLFLVVVPSPAFRDYPAWRKAGELSEGFLAELSRVTTEVDDDVDVVIINLPSHFRERDRDYLVTRSAAILWARSIRAWRQVQGIGNQVVAVGAARFVESVSTPTIEFGDDRVRIYFSSGSSTYTDPEFGLETSSPLAPSVGRGYEFVWPPADVADGRYEIFVFDGERLTPYSG